MKINTAFLIIAFLIAVQSSSAQVSELDKKIFKTAVWKKTTLVPGITWYQANIEGLFSSRQEINFVEIDLKKHRKRIALAALRNELHKTSVLANERNAVIAINGGFFNMKAGGAVDYLKVDKHIYFDSISKAGRADAFFAFDKNRTILTRDTNIVNEFDNVIQAGPYLVANNKILPLANNAFNDNRHPRTAIGIKGNKLVLLTVDGRNTKAQGMSLLELSQLFKLIGCSEAMNLDGGGSTTLYLNTPHRQGVVNYPSDNKNFDHDGERSVSNIIYIKGK